MPKMHSRFHVITGGPGSGKTTLLSHLAGQGYRVMPEAGRSIIRLQMEIDGPALPWGDRALFAEQMLAWDMRSYEAAEATTGPVLFDRGLPDVAGYLALEGLVVPAHIRRAAETWRYSPAVFIAPPWPEIFEQDSERRQDPEQAERTYHAMQAVYTSLGYRLIELPRASVPERAAFLAAHICE